MSQLAGDNHKASLTRKVCVLVPQKKMTGETAWRLTGIPAVGGRRDYAVVAIVLTAAGRPCCSLVLLLYLKDDGPGKKV